MVQTVSDVDITNISPQVTRLLHDRESARAAQDFTRSDLLRDQIKTLGYLVNDRPGGYELLKLGDTETKPAKSFLLLFGSGETAPSSVDIYRQTFLQLNKRDLRIILITTPAGFQPNVEHVYQEVKDFLLTSLPDFNLTIDILFANNLADANNFHLVSQLDSADIIFTGPGSPTYAAKHLNNSLLIKKIVERVKSGASLILASAATIAFSHHTLPVYEIYKVGEELHWQPGLNIYHALWQDLTVIPHFNNTEGGANLDTSYCFMGEHRATQLLAQLPPHTPVLGLDEHTALIIDLNSGEQQVRGKGSLHKVQ